jgi:glycosyltransferase involved in cell wall biosynthesis
VISSADPRVSVLLPARDAAATLPAALRSCLRQREPRLEVVLVDDGSTDGTAAVAARAAAQDGRVRVLRTAPEGLVHALSEGLAACRAPFVARMDADDWMHRDRLALQLAALEAAPELAGVGAHVRIFPRTALTDGRRAYERWLNAIDSPERVAAEAFVECPIAHPTLMLRREVLLAHGWRDAGWPEDYDLVLRLLGAGLQLGIVPRRLLGWRDAPERLSRRSPVYALERFTACKASFLASGLLARHRAYVLWGYGGTGRALRRALAVYDRHPSHVIELHPGRLGQRIHGAEVLPPEALRTLRGVPVIASVAGAGPRGQIRAALCSMGFREGRDFVCAA